MKEFFKNIPTKLFITILSALLFTVILSVRHAGFMLTFFIPIFIVWALGVSVKSIKSKENIKVNLLRIGVWALAIVIAFSVQYYRHTSARNVANEIVLKIENYKEKTGDYPLTLSDINIPKRELKDKLGMAGYFYEKKKISFFYAATHIPFDVYRYDFKRKFWVFSP